MAKIQLTVAEYVDLYRADRRLSRHASELEAITAADLYAHSRPGSFSLRLVYVGSKVRVVGTLPPRPEPGVPENLRLIEATNSFVTIAWTPAPDALTWTISRDSVELDTVNVAAYTDNTVAASTTYEYQVRANNSGGSSAYTAALEVTTAAGSAPAVPTGLTTSSNGITRSSVSLVWDTASNVTDWDVVRDAVDIATVTSATYLDTGLDPDTGYTYQIRANNTTGSSALTSGLAVVTLSNQPPIWSLTDISVPEDTGYSLDLSTVCDDADNDTLTFSVFVGSVPGLALNGSLYTGIPTTPGAYGVTFRADDGLDQVDKAITFTVTAVDTTAPTAPTNLVASANGSTVTLTWTASTDASGILNYSVERASASLSFGVRNDAWPASPYVETGVPDGERNYRVRARDASSNANLSAYSNVAQVIVNPPNPGPDTPISFSGFAPSSTSITLTWQAGPNGPAPTSYELNRATSASGPWSANLLSSLVTTFTDTGRTAGTQYFYRIRAVVAGTTTLINTNFGNYWMTGRAGDDHGNTPQLGQAYRFSNLYRTPGDPLSCFDSPEMKGVSVEWRWSDFETTQGNYSQGLALIRAEIDKLKTFDPPRRLWIQFRDEKQNVTYSEAFASGPKRLFPTYIGHTGLNAGYQYEDTGAGDETNRTSWNFTNAAAKTAFFAMWTGIINALKADPEYWDYIEGFRTDQELSGERFGSSSDNQGIANNPNVTISWAQYAAFHLEYAAHIRSLAPDKAIIIPVVGTFGSAAAKAQFLADLLPLDALPGHGDAIPRSANGLGTPDPFGPEADAELCGTAAADPAFTVDYRVASALWMAVEGSELGHTAYPSNYNVATNTPPAYTIPEMHGYMINPMQAHYIFWDCWEGPAATEENYEEIGAYIDAHPTVPSSIPANYSASSTGGVSGYATTNVTTLVAPGFNPPFPRLGGRHQGALASGISQATLDAQLQIIGKDHVFLFSGPRSWSGGTNTNLATLAAAIRNATVPFAGHQTHCFLYTNVTQTDITATPLIDKARAEGWVLLNGTPHADPTGEVLGNTANKRSTNYTAGTDVDHNGFRWPQWLAKYWTQPSTGGEDYNTPGRGISEGEWSGLYADDQGFGNVKSGDWDQDGTRDGNNDADTLAAVDAGFVAYGNAAKSNGTTLNTPSIYGGNFADLGSHGTLWPVARRDFYDMGLCERCAGYEPNRGWGLYDAVEVNGDTGTGFMGRYWRPMRYAKGKKLVIFEVDLTDLRLSNRWGNISPENTFSDWRWVRYHLASCCFDDGFFCVDQHTPTWNTHTPWYDEYDGGVGVKQTGWLGLRIGTPPRAVWNNSIWKAEFDNGMVLINPYQKPTSLNATRTVTLPSAGAGKVWKRLLADPSLPSGVQDPVVNNGATNVTTVTLQNHDALFLRRVNG